MACEQLGIEQNHCIHRSRFSCYPAPDAPAPVGIVLAMTGERSAQDVIDAWGAPSGDPCAPIPLSADYLVRVNGGLDQLLPDNCVSSPTCSPTSNRYIVVVLEGQPQFAREQLKVAARLICCLARHYNLLDATNTPLLDAIGAIDPTKPLFDIPPLLWAYINSCMSGDVVSEESQPSCCIALGEALARANQRIDELIDRVRVLEQRPDVSQQVEILRGLIASLEQRVCAYEAQLQNLINTTGLIQARLTKLECCYEKLPQCQERAPACDIHYRIGLPQRLVPTLQNVVNFDVKITDDDPPRVITGPLWQAAISLAGEPARTWYVSGEITIAARRWCANKGVRVYLQQCDGSHLLVTQYIASADGPQPPITLSFNSFAVSTSGTPCFVRLIVVSDDTTEPFFVIDGGYIRIAL
jgi:hypothetical protein